MFTVKCAASSPSISEELTWDQINNEEGIYSCVSDFNAKGKYFITLRSCSHQGVDRCIVLILDVDGEVWAPSDVCVWERDKFVRLNADLVMEVRVKS